jgi:hypothetical protein
LQMCFTPEYRLELLNPFGAIACTSLASALSLE